MRNPRKCLNCGTKIQGDYCSKCGQRVREPRVPLFGLFRELFATVFNLDSRFFRSMGTLISRPGLLTQRYLAGKRASMLSPLRMYLVLSLLLFLAVDIPVPDARKYDLYINDQLVGGRVADPARKDLHIGSSAKVEFFSNILKGKDEKLRQMDPQRALDTLFKGIEGSLSKALILFIPLVALVLKLLFIRGQILYYDHVIFALHFQSFLFMLIAGSWCLSWLAPQAFLTLFFSPIYLALAMRRVYNQHWLWTSLKWFALLNSYLFVLGFVLLATFVHIMLQV